MILDIEAGAAAVPRRRDDGEGVMRIGTLGAPELILIVLAIVLIFGASKLGDIGGAVGKSIKEFKKASRDETAATQSETEIVTPEPAKLNGAATTTAASAEKEAEPVAIGDYRPPDAKTS
jgi:sec-independent protein translocase protein TatA